MRQFSLIACACLLALSLCACQSSKPAESAAPSTTTTQTPTTTTTAAPQYDTNFLTGCKDVEQGQYQHPIGIMVGNNDKSRPQYGLDKADMLVEAETEGGITRIMAVFSNPYRVPTIGPVRSARTPFVSMASALGAVYCHAGGSSAGLKAIDSQQLTHVNALAHDGGIGNKNQGIFWRDNTLYHQKGMEYSMLTKGSLLVSQCATQRVSQKLIKNPPFSFGTLTMTQPCTELQCTMSGLQTVNFRYDEAAKLYTKYNGTLTSGLPHKTADGACIRVSNVVVLYANRYDENKTTINFTLTNGEGLAVSAGHTASIQWKVSSSGLTLTNADGTPLRLTAGKMYVCLTSTAMRSRTIAK